MGRGTEEVVRVVKPNPWTLPVAVLMMTLAASSSGCRSGAERTAVGSTGAPGGGSAVAGWEGFFPPSRVTERWLGERGIELHADGLPVAARRVAKLVIDDGEREADLAELLEAERRYCAEPGVRAWNEDRCRGLGERVCDGDRCRYRHFGNCSGLLLGGGVFLTAAHCVDGLVDRPELRATSSVLVPGPGDGPAARLPLGAIRAAMGDFDHHWVVVDSEPDPLDVAAILVDDGGLTGYPTAPLPGAGEVVFIVGFPRVEDRRPADRERAGYGLVFGTPAVSFGRVADRNEGDLPLCNIDGSQEHWRLARPCPTGETTVEGFGTWTGVITGSPFLATFDSCNGYSGAPVFDAEGSAVGVNVTVASATDPREAFDPQARMVAIPIERALARLGLSSPP